MTVEDFVFDQVLRASAVRVDYGGKGLNVSRALKALGMESTALGFLGGGTGETLNAGLVALGIGTDFVPVHGETRTNISIVNGDHTHFLKVNAPGPEITPGEQAALLHKIRRRAQRGDWWVLSGGLPLGVPVSIYSELIHTIQTVGGLAILDADREPLHMGCSAGPFLVKPNATEASWLLGTRVESPDNASHAVRAIHDLGAKQVVISLGSQGAVGSDGQGIWHAQPPIIQGRNPIGAGDALVAGLVWGLHQGYSQQETLRWGVACGAAAASLDGTAVGTREHVESLVTQVRVTSIS